MCLHSLVHKIVFNKEYSFLRFCSGSLSHNAKIPKGIKSFDVSVYVRLHVLQDM